MDCPWDMSDISLLLGTNIQIYRSTLCTRNITCRLSFRGRRLLLASSEDEYNREQGKQSKTDHLIIRIRTKIVVIFNLIHRSATTNRDNSILRKLLSKLLTTHHWEWASATTIEHKICSWWIMITKKKIRSRIYSIVCRLPNHIDKHYRHSRLIQLFFVSKIFCPRPF